MKRTPTPIVACAVATGVYAIAFLWVGIYIIFGAGAHLGDDGLGGATAPYAVGLGVISLGIGVAVVAQIVGIVRGRAAARLVTTILTGITLPCVLLLALAVADTGVFYLIAGLITLAVGGLVLVLLWTGVARQHFVPRSRSNIRSSDGKRR